MDDATSSADGFTAEPKASQRSASLPRKPNEVDVHLGRRLRLRRVALGLSQEQLGRRLGLAFQQVQKYELGTNRISASRLYQLATELQIPILWFFEGLNSVPAANHGQAGHQKAIASAAEAPDRETLELIRTYQRIADHGLRKQVHEIACILAQKGEG